MFNANDLAIAAKIPPHTFWLQNLFMHILNAIQKQFVDRRAQTQSRVAREPIPLGERAAFSPAEFGALCGRPPTWGYLLESDHLVFCRI